MVEDKKRLFFFLFSDSIYTDFKNFKYFKYEASQHFSDGDWYKFTKRGKLMKAIL